MPSSGSQAPTLPPGPVHPRVSPSTSALSLVLSHRDWKRKSAICWASYMSPHWWGRGLGRGKPAPQPWGLGAPCWSLS